VGIGILPSYYPALSQGSSPSLLWRSADQTIESHEQVLCATQRGILPIGGWVSDQARIDQPPSKRTQRNLRLEPGEGCSDTVVDAAKAEMLVVRAVGVEAFGIWEAGRVATARIRRPLRRSLSSSEAQPRSRPASAWHHDTPSHRGMTFLSRRSPGRPGSRNRRSVDWGKPRRTGSSG
jgi:hypothetical protein